MSQHKQSFLSKVFYLYYDGFRNMTIGRTLWAVVIVKLFIMFVVLRIFFFPNFLKNNAPEGREADYVGNQMVERMPLNE